MAKPILLELPPRDPRAELRARLDAAPVEHAEAMLAAYEVLQGLHDNGVLEVLRGALGSSDKVLEIAVEAAKAPGSIRSIRNLFLAVNMLSEVDPEELSAFTKTVPIALKALAEPRKPMSLWRLAMIYLRDQDIRRGLSALTLMLQTLGGSLGRLDAHREAASKPPRA